MLEFYRFDARAMESTCEDGRRSFCAWVWGCLAAGCPKGKPDYQQGRKAENLQDYDAAYDFYQKALKQEPENAEYQIKFNQARFEAGAFHVKQGVKLREQGNLQARWASSSAPRRSIRRARWRTRRSERPRNCSASRTTRAAEPPRAAAADRERSPLLLASAPRNQAAVARADQPAHGE